MAQKKGQPDTTRRLFADGDGGSFGRALVLLCAHPRDEEAEREKGALWTTGERGMSKMKRDAAIAGRASAAPRSSGRNKRCRRAVEAIERASKSAGRVDSSTSAGRAAAANMPGWASLLFCGEEPVRPVDHTRLAVHALGRASAAITRVCPARGRREHRAFKSLLARHPSWPALERTLLAAQK
ncbi:hypothetical protein MTO96_011692 [Rhipicephalus appendiculatus]